MATNPKHRHETEAAAAALLLGMRYSLPALIRQQGIKPRPFRRIIPTEALRAGVAAPYFDIVRAWRTEQAALLATYTAALPPRGRQPSADASRSVERQVGISAARVAAVALVAGRLSAPMSQVERWHRSQWNNRIKSATGLDVAMFTGAQDGAAAVANAAVRAEQLAGAINSEIQHKVATALINSLSARTPAADVGLGGTFDAAKARAARIGIDQAGKLTEELTTVRRLAAGLLKWKWRHTAQRHPRPDHLARDGTVYTPGNQPNSMPGQLAFCQCWQEVLFDEL